MWFLMASSSANGYNKEVNYNQHQQVQNSFSQYKNGGSSHGSEWGMPTFQHQPIISMEWSHEEQIILEECLAKYAPESHIIRYAKIAVQLKNKTVRDVALRCRWMTKKELNKKRKEDLTLNARKGKERKELVIDSSGKPSRLGIQSGLSHGPGPVHNHNDDVISYNDINGMTRQLLQHNACAFKQISTNLTTHQVHENIGLLSKARDNIFQILANLNEMAPTLKKMGPLPKLDEDLAKSILPPSNYSIQL